MHCTLIINEAILTNISLEQSSVKFVLFHEETLKSTTARKVPRNG